MINCHHQLVVPDQKSVLVYTVAEANKILKQRQKIIRLADESELGWKVVNQYLQSEIASDEEDQKNINRAQARARAKVR